MVLLKSSEKIETLTELGLTNNQARTYLTLLQTAGHLTAKELADTSKIARPDIYRILPALQKAGLVEQIMTRPASYEAISPLQVLPFLLEQKTTQQQELKKKTRALLNDINTNPAKKECETAAEFILVPQHKALIEKLKDALLQAQTSVSVVTSSSRFKAALVTFRGDFRKALDSGVKIQVVTDYFVPKLEAQKTLQALLKYPTFEIRYLADAPPAIVGLYDCKEVLVSLSPLGQLGVGPSLWSNNPSFVVLVQNYFENYWHHTSDAYGHQPLII
ncbi:MAG: hypothetical protein NWE92_04610 [Candidatus Bathyarchaeota archaeon]|nr:hypothetical protein [Candidatus Bathyarchaeota archaeon]